MSQPRQSGFSDVHLWQQHRMYSQIHELQRQQRLQQLDQQARQQNSSNHFSGIAKQAVADQLPLVVTGTPIHGASNYVWKNEHVGGESKIPSSSQMSVVGNTNWTKYRETMSLQRYPNGLVFSQNLGQPLQSIGLTQQPPDHSLYGTPVSSNRNIMDQYSHFSGISNKSAELMTETIGNQVEKQPMHTGAFNSFQREQRLLPEQLIIQDGAVKQSVPGKPLFGKVPAQNINNGIISGNFRQLTSLGRSMQFPQPQGRQERTVWSGNSQDKRVMQVGPYQGHSNLDSSEQKLLFGIDDEGSWRDYSVRSGSISSEGFLCGNLLEDNGYCEAAPSVQSGSWSALMQSAVAEASSSDTGLQDEWSGLSLLPKYPSSSDHPPAFNGGGKHQTTWVENLQSSSTLTSIPVPLSNDADASTKECDAAMFPQCLVKSAYDDGQKVDSEASTSCQLDQRQLHQKIINGVVQAQTHFGSSSSGAWVGQLYDQPHRNIHAKHKLNQQSLHGTHAHQPNMLLYNIGSQTSKMDAWNINELLPSAGDAMLNVDDRQTTVQHSWVNCPKGGTHMQKDLEGNMWKTDGCQKSVSFPHPTSGFKKFGISSPQMLGDIVGRNSNNSETNQEVNQQSLTRDVPDYGKLVFADSPVESKGNDNEEKCQHKISKDPLGWESSVNIFEKASRIAYGRIRENSSQREVSNEDYFSSNSHPVQPNDAEVFRNENSLVAASDSSHSASGNRRNSCQSGQNDSRPHRFHFHPMRNLEDGVELDNPKESFCSQGQFQMVPCGMKSQREPDFIGQLQFAPHAASNSGMDMDELQLFDSQRNVKGTEEMDFRGRISTYDLDIPSYEGSVAIFSQNKSGQTSRNMLELFHKVDQSRESSTASHPVFSNHNKKPESPDRAASDMHPYLLHTQSSAFQGISVALPLKHQSVLNHSLSSQAVDSYNSRHVDSEVQGEKNVTCTASTASVCTLPPSHEASQRGKWDYKSNLFGQWGKDAPQSKNMQENSTEILASRLSYARNHLQQRQQRQQLWQKQQQQQQQQEISVASGSVAIDQSFNMPYGYELDQDACSKSPLHIEEFIDLHTEGMHGEAIVDQSGQQLLPAVCQIPPFKLAASDGQSPVMSYPYSSDNGQLQVMGVTSCLRRSSQLPRPEIWPVSQLSVTPVMPQQGAFPGMLQNVWTNVPIQHHLSSNLPTEVMPNLSQPANLSSLDMNAWSLQRSDNQGNMKGQAALKFGTCLTTSQLFTYGQQQAGKDSSLRQIPPQNKVLTPCTSSAPQVQESVSQHTSDGNSLHIPLMVQIHQQEIGRAEYGQGPILDKQMDHASLLNITSSSQDHVGLSSVQLQNHFLLQQLQAMKADLSKRHGKRLKGGDSNSDAEQMAGKSPQHFIYGCNMVSTVPADDKLCAYQSSFPSDTKMLSFSLEANENQNIVRDSQLVGSDFHSQDEAGAAFSNPQNYSSLSMTSMPSLVSVTQPKHFDPQMGPSWFEQCGKLKNGQNLAMYNGLGGQQKISKAPVQHYFLSKASENMSISGASQVRSFWHGCSTNSVNEESSSLHYACADVVDHNLVPRPKKRKTASSDLLPWHKEITKGADKLWNISVAEVDWAQLTNRLIEKVEAKAQINEDGLPIPRARGRLVLTTQLMHQLLPAVPKRILTADVTSEYDSVTYLVAKLALGDACGRISCSRRHFNIPSDSRNMISEKLKTTGGGEQFFSEVVEESIGGVRKLENDLSRLRKRASVLDIRVECQDLERSSIVNRLAKFHGRGRAEAVGSLSTPENDPQKMFPLGYVAALSMPGNPPEGIVCLSL